MKWIILASAFISLTLASFAQQALGPATLYFSWG